MALNRSYHVVRHLRVLGLEHPQYLSLSTALGCLDDVTDTTGKRTPIHAALGSIIVSPFPALPIVAKRSFSEQTLFPCQG